jgi:hypothetical protein
MSWLLAPFAVLLGIVLTTQVATNTLLGRALGNDYIPAAVNMAIGLDPYRMEQRRIRSVASFMATGEGHHGYTGSRIL